MVGAPHSAAGPGLGFLCCCCCCFVCMYCSTACTVHHITMWRTYLELFVPGCFFALLWLLFFHSSNPTTNQHLLLQSKERRVISEVASRLSTLRRMLLVLTGLIYHFRSPIAAVVIEVPNLFFFVVHSYLQRITVDSNNPAEAPSYRSGYASDLFLHTQKTRGTH